MKALMAVAVSGILLGLTGHPDDVSPVLTGQPEALGPVRDQPPPQAPQPQLPLTPTPPTTRVVPAEIAGRAPDREGPPEVSPEALTTVVRRLCGTCHNDQLMTGNLSLEHFDVAAAPAMAATAEKMIVKLRAGMMPPPGIPRPGGDTLVALAATLERLIDEAAAKQPNPGGRTFQRLNRPEYERAVRDLLGLEVDAGDWLPLDTKSANFDNIADVQLPSPTVLNAYMRAAAEISRLAIGDPDASPSSVTYDVPRLASQREHLQGAPHGTRGGLSVVHTFPADGEYVFTLMLYQQWTGQLFGKAGPFEEQIEVSINGERVALLDVDRWMLESDPEGMTMETDPVLVRAGPQRVSAAFIKNFEGPVIDNIAPIGHSIADTQIGTERGITNLVHLRNLTIAGPYNATGVSATPSRQRIFTCRPLSAAEERPCAEEILGRLGAEAYRKPLTAETLDGLLSFYEAGAAKGGFEEGIRVALQAILASPDFVFRFEELPANADPGDAYQINDLDLASRLSFFLWGTPPDAELMRLATEGRLSDANVLRQQARRMLDDPRSAALATRFAAQWLRLQDLDKIQPDALRYPDFDKQLANAMRRETELFFSSIVREDRSVLELFTADYTFLNEGLAKHYGIPGVVGEAFRRVEYPDDRRRGLLGQGSILTLTSHAGRTSPVLRGKWVMEVLLGTPPPPPPPGVPDLEETAGSEGGRMLTTRERMEIHRANPVCNSCHQFMDPIGLALDNFGVTGKWRIRENGVPLDTRGTLYDGTPISTPMELQQALLQRPIPLIRNFTVNLMAYALGRRVEYYDQPTVRAIAREAKANDYRISSFILGVIESDAFQMKRAAPAVVAEGPAARGKSSSSTGKGKSSGPAEKRTSNTSTEEGKSSSSERSRTAKH